MKRKVADSHLSLSCKIEFDGEVRFETIAYQMQLETLTILSVIDGYKIRYYKTYEEIPKNLIFEHKLDGCYWYRSLETQEVHAFFLNSVHYYLLHCEEEYYLNQNFNIHLVK